MDQRGALALRWSPHPFLWLHRLQALDPLLDRWMGVEQAVEKARLVVERVRDVERRGRLVGHFERLLVAGELAGGRRETGGAPREGHDGGPGLVAELARPGCEA